jgi:acyl carrier protein
VSAERGVVLRGVQRIAHETFRCDPALIQDDTVADDVPGWDSLSHTIFIMTIEQTFGVEFSVQEVIAFKCVGDLVSALTARTKSL